MDGLGPDFSSSFCRSQPKNLISICLLFLLCTALSFGGGGGSLSAAGLEDFYEADSTIRVKAAEEMEKFDFEIDQQTEAVELSGEKRDIPAGDYRLRTGEDSFTVYAVQVLAAESLSRAREMKDELIAAGFAGVKILSEDDLHKVQVGAESTRQEASRLENELAGTGFSGWITTRESERESRQLLLKKIYEDGQSEQKLSGKNIAIEDDIFQDGYLYPNRSEFYLEEKGFSFFGEPHIDDAVRGGISELLESNDLELSSPALAALSVTVRSGLLWDYIHSERGYITLDEYPFAEGRTGEIYSAVEETKDLYLNQGGELVRGYFHLSSGGITAGSNQISDEAEAAGAVTSMEDEFAPEHGWERTYSSQHIEDELIPVMVDLTPALNVSPPGIRDIEAVSRTEDGRVQELSVDSDYGNFYFSGEEMGELLSGEDFKLPSLLFEIETDISRGELEEFTLTGKGSGSGLGLPLESAAVMAREGYEWEDILDYYFHEVDIDPLEEIYISRELVDATVQRGLNYREIRQDTVRGARRFTMLRLDLDNRWLNLKPVIAGGDIASGSQDLIEVGSDRGALAGVNGGFFDGQGRPLGMFIQDGSIVTESISGLDRTALVGDAEDNLSIGRYSWQGTLHLGGDKIEISGVNRPAASEEAVLINHNYGKDAPRLDEQGVEIVVRDGEIEGIHRGILSYPLTVPEEGYIIQTRGAKANKLGRYESGDSVKLEENISPPPEGLSADIDFALEAGPRLLKAGNIHITAEEEGFQPDIVSGRAPRTALGLTGDDELLLVTVDGRQPERSIGITLDNLAALMQRLGAVEAMNLDGGASARMMVRGFTMNIPSADRVVSNALLILPE